VVDGSVLLGTTFPAADRPTANPGFTAVLLVTGAFQEVFDAYRRQAADLGVRLRPALNAEAAPSLCWRDRAAQAFVCNGSGNLGGEVTGPTVTVTAYRAPAVGRRPPLSHLLLRYDDAGPGEPGAPIADLGRAHLSDDPPLPNAWPALPEAGDAYEAPQGQRPLRVPRGAELVGPPLVNPDCGSTGSLAVLSSEADPDRVVRDLIPHDADVLQRDTFRDGDTENADVAWDWGGGTYHALSTSRAGQPGFVLVSHCGTD
jgi:hypothetical protein